MFVLKTIAIAKILSGQALLLLLPIRLDFGEHIAK